MSDPSSSNHYAVLGVERGADVRAIKKAYFALVRKFPPETHADEFKKIRAAYEVLSDAEARERYDEQEKGFREFDDDVAEALGKADAAAKEGNDKLVEETLRPLFEARPEVLLVRERLAASLSRTGEDDEALRLIEGLVERSPETARYRHIQGLQLRKLKRFEDAVAALRKACELAPDEPGHHAALVDALAAADHTDEALEELETAAKRHEPGSPEGLGVQIRRIDLLFSVKERAATAARLFAANDVAHANEVLRCCHELHPESAVLHPYPPRVTVPSEALPPAGLAWLAEQQPAPGTPVIRHARGSRTLGAVVGVGVVLLACYLLLTETPIHDGELPAQRPGSFVGDPAGALFILALLGFASYLGVRVWGAARARLTGQLDRITTIHPLYLVRTEVDRVDLYSLFCLTSCDGAHHRQNGVYTHTQLRMVFEELEVSIAFNNAQFAQSWLNALLATRKRAIELLAAGYLDAEGAVPLLPKEGAPEAAARAVASAKAARKQLFLRAAAIAVGLWAVVLLSQWHRGDDIAFGEAAYRDKVAAYDWYLGLFPEGAHVRDARSARSRALERAQASLATWLDPRAKGSAALAKAVAALEDAGATSLPVAFEIRVQGADSGPQAVGERFGKLSEEIAATLAYAGISAAAHIERTTAPGRAKAAIAVSCTVASGAPALTADCALRVFVAGAAVFETSVASSIDTGPGAPLDGERAARQVFDAVAARITGELGLGGAHEERRRGLKPTGKSPYDG